MATREWQEKNADKMRQYRRDYYLRNKEREKARITKTNAARNKELREWFDEYRETLSCKQCGEDHMACLEFHHRDPNDKEIDVARAISNGWRKERILEEIEKCDVLCANCHKKLHWEERKLQERDVTVA